MDPTPASAKVENIAKIEANAIAFNFTMRVSSVTNAGWHGLNLGRAVSFITAFNTPGLRRRG
jgi:hypothetical protein